MKLIDYLRSLARIPKILEDLDRRLKLLENPPETVKIVWPSRQEPSIQTVPYVYPKYVQAECPGGCEFPSHYVGDYVPCMKCGRTVPSLRTIITCGGDQNVS